MLEFNCPLCNLYPLRTSPIKNERKFSVVNLESLLTTATQLIFSVVVDYCRMSKETLKNEVNCNIIDKNDGCKFFSQESISLYTT